MSILIIKGRLKVQSASEGRSKPVVRGESKMKPFDLDRFWQHLSEVLHQLDRRHNTDNIGPAEQLLIRAEDCQGVESYSWKNI